jgi:hypothetical protein
MKGFIGDTFGSMKNFLIIMIICVVAVMMRILNLDDGLPVVMFGMAALTADKKLEYKEGVEVPVPVKTLTEIFAGSFLCVDATGWGVPGADTAGLIFQGASRTYIPSTSGNGAATAIARRRGLVKATFGTAISQANVGDNVFLVDDQTVDLIGNVTNGIFCGVIAEYIDATHAYIDIEPAIKQADVATHIADVSGAHAASAISTTDAGAHFPAATDTVEEQIQDLANGPFFLTLPRFTGWTKDGAAHAIALPAVESPVPVMIKRAYVNLGTAPGAGKTLALTVNGSALASIGEANTQGEAEALSIAIAANTDIVISANETAAGAGANCDIILALYKDDGE